MATRVRSLAAFCMHGVHLHSTFSLYLDVHFTESHVYLSWFSM